MPNPPPPKVPNFNPGVGRLAVDRYDFEAHIEGTKFRHNATQIDLFPTLVIDGYTKTTVQDALALLAILVTPPVIPDATTSQKGIVQLTGDIAGTATNVIVTRIQGKPVNTSGPSLNDVLTWNGSTWGPAAPPNGFIANGDLSGTSILQNVIGLTGSAGIVTATCDTIRFILSVANPTFTQSINTGAAGHNMTMLAQSSSFAGGKGGDVIIAGGSPGGGGLKGGIKLQVDSGSANLLQITEVAAGRRVLSLLHPTSLTTGDMPSASGDMVMYVRDAATIPSPGTIPVNGTIMYSTGGQLWVNQGDGQQFAIGTIPNPSIWGPPGQQTVTYRSFVPSPVFLPVAIVSFNLTDNAATKFDVIIVGKDTVANESAQFNFSIGYSRTGGISIDVGSLTSTDPRATPAASLWLVPNIIRAGNTVSIISGMGPNVINWLAISQLTIQSGP